MIFAIKGDITKITDVQAIVNAANESLLGGGGVDGAIHYAAGPELLEECRTLGGCRMGEAKVTKAYNLPCDYVIHTVGPRWHGGSRGEADTLRDCYINSLKVAIDNGIRTIAFPSISTGAFGYPVEEAASVAVNAVNEFLIENSDKFDDVYWILFDNYTCSVYDKAIRDIQDSGNLYLDVMLKNPDIMDAFLEAIDLGNLGVIAPHKDKYIYRYDINWLIDKVNSGEKLKYVTFWKADEGCENNYFGQWYADKPIVINGREYATAEQYMMSEKALLFNDLEAYEKIMKDTDPRNCKALGRTVKNFNGDLWDKCFREIIFHGNLAKMQSDIKILNALLETEDAVLIEASPTDDIYGAGMEKKNLLNPDGTLKVLPQNWHKKNSTRQAENNLGFVLMGVRDLFRELMDI